MEIVLTLITAYLAVYSWYLFRLIRGFQKVPIFKPAAAKPENLFSIIIPFRNESENLPALLQSLSALNYPHEMMEFIFINDQSTDDSDSLVNRWRLANPTLHTTMIDSVRLSASPKKDALQRALPIAIHPYIITTDADCQMPPDWLLTFDSFIRQTAARFIAGPVVYIQSRKPLAVFQQTDFITLQAAGIGGFGLRDPFMCNAANLCFEVDFFKEIGGFQGNAHFASGDDVFLLQKAWSKQPDAVRFLASREAVVTSIPPQSLGALFMQRVRWASKAKAYISKLGEEVSLAVFFGNSMFLLGMILTLFNQVPWYLVCLWLTLKIIPDYVLSRCGHQMLHPKRVYLPLGTAFLYPIFSTLVGLYALNGTYYWKGRKLR